MRKNLCIGAAALLMLVGCTPKATHQLVQPLPAGLTMENLSDATMHVAFSANDFDWKSNTLRIKVYTEDLYDTVEVNHLQTGDTLIYDGNRIVVDSLVIDGSYITVNNGIEEGGANLVAHEGGTYRAMQLDDHSTYSKLGETTLPLRSDFAFIVCGENPTDPYDTIRVNPQAYLAELPDYKQEFTVLDTEVRIENDSIVSITRLWIP